MSFRPIIPRMPVPKPVLLSRLTGTDHTPEIFNALITADFPRVASIIADEGPELADRISDWMRKRINQHQKFGGFFSLLRATVAERGTVKVASKGRWGSNLRKPQGDYDLRVISETSRKQFQ